MKIKLHRHLDRKIWDKTQNIQPDVANMLLSIAWAYIDYVRNEYDMPIRNCDIIDIFVFGSITQYFYDSDSDIDLCIVLNLDLAEQQFPNSNINKMLKLYYYDWAMVHICKIYGRKIDLNFQDVKTPEYEGMYRTGPIYSLVKHEWLVNPVRLSRKELKELETKSDIVYKQIVRDYKLVKKNGFKSDEIQRLYANIQASKSQSIHETCEPVRTPVYMAIRKFKHDGYIKKLQNKAIKKETEKYVLK